MIAEDITKESYMGDGLTKSFPFSFPFDDAADIHAIIHDMDTGIETEITSDYYIDTVAGTYNYPGYAPGEEAPLAEQPAVLTSTQKIVIYRATPQTQLIDLGEKYPLPVIEKISDKLTLILQEHKEQLDRAIKVALGSDTVPDQLMAELNQAVINAVAASQEAMAQSGAAGASAAAAADSAASAAGSATEATGSAENAANSATAAQQIVDTAVADIIAKALEEARAYGVPVGTIIPYSANGDLPSGFLLCDGASVPREMYPNLFTVIGTTYGAVDEAHFNLPNLIDEFIQYGNVAGIKKEAGLPNIEGGFRPDGQFNNIYTGANGAFSSKAASSTYKFNASNGMVTATVIDFDASRANSIYGNSTTVQPPSLTARPIIKAFDGQTAYSSLIDVTQYAQELANKVNRSEADYVVDSYHDDDGNWYRVYKSGWVEQGGYVTGLSDTSTTTVNFLKPFVNTRYSIVVTREVNGRYNTAHMVSNRYETHMIIYTNTIILIWSCAGQGANV